MGTLLRLVILAGLLAICASLYSAAGPLNGFELDDALVDLDYVRPGGPPRDGIPAIDDPALESVERAGRWLADDHRVLGIARGDEARAYPIAVLNWHEIVNDVVGGQPLLVTWCPLCGSGVAYEPGVDAEGRPLQFGVSGLLYNSDVLLFDRATESLWSQLEHRAVSGPMRGTRLRPVFMRHTSFADWRNRYPHSQVMARPTDVLGRPLRDYGINPYAGYVLDRQLLFPVRDSDRRFHPKEEVFGVELDGAAVAWPFSELARMRSPVRDRVGTREILVHFDPEHGTAWATDAAGDPLPGLQAFWFAWYAFHPDTEVRMAP